jgi:hypothetical protein
VAVPQRVAPHEEGEAEKGDQRVVDCAVKSIDDPFASLLVHGVRRWLGGGVLAALGDEHADKDGQPSFSQSLEHGSLLFADSIALYKIYDSKAI